MTWMLLLAACGDNTSQMDSPTEPPEDTGTPATTACTETPWYTDADGDGFGDPASESWACEAPDGAIADGSDCDDAADDAFPGAPELCDGRWTDCDQVWEDDAGRVTWTDAEGATTALGETWATLTQADRQVLDEPGTLSICPGTWTVPLQVDAEVTVQGIGGADAVVLSGSETVQVVNGASSDATLRDLTLADGRSDQWGGLVQVPQAGTWTLTAVTLRGGSAYMGGGLAAVGATLVILEDCTFTRNAAVAGGGLLTEDSSLHASGTTWEGNLARRPWPCCQPPEPAPKPGRWLGWSAGERPAGAQPWWCPGARSWPSLQRSCCSRSVVD